MISPACHIIKSWWDSNKIETNPSKSCILRIAYKKCKLRHIDNPLNINEVDSYNYLGVTFDQGLRFNRIPPIIKQIEGLIRTKIKRINFKEIDMVSIKNFFFIVYAAKDWLTVWSAYLIYLNHTINLSKVEYTELPNVDLESEVIRVKLKYSKFLVLTLN